jgi:hypothetical protein
MEEWVHAALPAKYITALTSRAVTPSRTLLQKFGGAMPHMSYQVPFGTHTVIVTGLQNPYDFPLGLYLCEQVDGTEEGAQAYGSGSGSGMFFRFLCTPGLPRAKTTFDVTGVSSTLSTAAVPYIVCPPHGEWRGSLKIRLQDHRLVGQTPSTYLAEQFEQIIDAARTTYNLPESTPDHDVLLSQFFQYNTGTMLTKGGGGSGDVANDVWTVDNSMNPGLHTIFSILIPDKERFSVTDAGGIALLWRELFDVDKSLENKYYGDRPKTTDMSTDASAEDQQKFVTDRMGYMDAVREHWDIKCPKYGKREMKTVSNFMFNKRAVMHISHRAVEICKSVHRGEIKSHHFLQLCIQVGSGPLYTARDFSALYTAMYKNETTTTQEAQQDFQQAGLSLALFKSSNA